MECISDLYNTQCVRAITRHTTVYSCSHSKNNNNENRMNTECCHIRKERKKTYLYSEYIKP